ncbi:MAG TPA: DUF423 domain-containing protein [Verrucomicrobiae bacterium]|nr:DUF423 domain-containing protein [Verrucomicrobiae bacterium]
MICNRDALRVAAATGFAAVALGAFGAHGFKSVLEQNQTTAIWQTAVLYHLVHAVMLVVVALRKPLLVTAWWGFLAGILLFSGSLYVLAITNAKWLGAITPIGGVSFLVGWVWIAIKAAKLSETGRE